MKIVRGAATTRYMLKDLHTGDMLVDFVIDNEVTEDLNHHIIREIVSHMTGDMGVVIANAESVDLRTIAKSLTERKSVVLLNHE